MGSKELTYKTNASKGALDLVFTKDTTTVAEVNKFAALTGIVVVGDALISIDDAQDLVRDVQRQVQIDQARARDHARLREARVEGPRPRRGSRVRVPRAPRRRPRGD